MTRTFDPIRILKSLSRDLLRELFIRHHADPPPPWAEISQRNTAPLMAAWESMSDAGRGRMQVILHEVFVLSGEEGMNALSPLITKAGRDKIDTSNVQVRGGEFVAGLLEALMDEPQLIEAACQETMQHAADRKSVLIFASGVRHGQHVVDTLRKQHGIECGFVTGETPSGERDKLLARFKSGELRFLCNVNVLTTGFDAPNVDCIVLLRPTMSPGL